MNDHQNRDRMSDEDAAANLTAHALGQLEGREREEIVAKMTRPDGDDARRLVEEMRLIADVLQADVVQGHGADGPQSLEAAGRSHDLRRTVVAAIAAAPPATNGLVGFPHGRSSVTTTIPDHPRRRRRRPWGLLALAGSLAAAILVAATVLLDRPQDIFAPSPRQVARVDAPMPTATERSEATRTLSEPEQVAAAAPAPAAKARAFAAEQGGKGFGVANRAAPDGLARSDTSMRRSTIPLPSPARVPAASAETISREQYGRFEENRSRVVSDEPLSTFSIDVDTASYANVRRFLSAGQLPPKDAVRIEEMLNYFRYDYPLPEGDDPFSVSLESAACPWSEGRLLVRIGLRGRDIDRSQRPAGNIVFLVDVSGSMQQPDKLPLVKQALAMLVEELTENDRVSIVTYAGNAGLVLPPTTGDQKNAILSAINGLVAGGSTHGSAGVQLAYEQAAEHFIEGGANRVILATDGDLNVGITSDAALVELIKQKAAGGTFLTVLGFGQGNLQDGKMENLADNGNGVYAYIDGVREARKVLIEQLTGSTITIAKDVKVQVEFNPGRVASYRLLGYENRSLAARDFRDDRKDAGEIGAGHTVTALYEVVPVAAAGLDVAGPGAEPLKYQQQPDAAPPATDVVPSDELLTVKLRFKNPDGQTSMLREFPLSDHGGSFDAASVDLRFAAAVAAFGMLIRGSEQAGTTTFDDVARIAGRAIGRDEGGYRAEFLDLVRKAGSLRGSRDPSGQE